jgi:deazaflavin-dependent oxidoreductase (nitroreductase family)
MRSRSIPAESWTPVSSRTCSSERVVASARRTNHLSRWDRAVVVHLRSLRPTIARLEAAQLRLLGRSLLGSLSRTDVLVLTSRGRKSGAVRETPLAYVEHDGGWLISGGAFGQRAVDWVANIRSRPHASITLRRVRLNVVAEALSGDHYEIARTIALRRWPRISTYERRAGRSVPIFLLRPAREPPCPSRFAVVVHEPGEKGGQGGSFLE